METPGDPDLSKSGPLNEPCIMQMIKTSFEKHFHIKIDVYHKLKPYVQEQLHERCKYFQSNVIIEFLKDILQFSTFENVENVENIENCGIFGIKLIDLKDMDEHIIECLFEKNERTYQWRSEIKKFIDSLVTVGLHPHTPRWEKMMKMMNKHIIWMVIIR